MVLNLIILNQQYYYILTNAIFPLKDIIYNYKLYVWWNRRQHPIKTHKINAEALVLRPPFHSLPPGQANFYTSKSHPFRDVGPEEPLTAIADPRLPQLAAQHRSLLEHFALERAVQPAADFSLYVVLLPEAQETPVPHHQKDVYWLWGGFWVGQYAVVWGAAAGEEGCVSG